MELHYQLSVLNLMKVVLVLFCHFVCLVLHLLYMGQQSDWSKRDVKSAIVVDPAFLLPT